MLAGLMISRILGIIDRELAGKKNKIILLIETLIISIKNCQEVCAMLSLNQTNRICDFI